MDSHAMECITIPHPHLLLGTFFVLSCLCREEQKGVQKPLCRTVENTEGGKGKGGEIWDNEKLHFSLIAAIK